MRGDEYSLFAGAKEYAFVSKGTSTKGDWVNNFQQPLGASTDMKESIEKAKHFANNEK